MEILEKYQKKNDEIKINIKESYFQLDVKLNTK